ncbi:MAG: hypothetical protein DMG81_03360 [Acidobacteria bacterium]|nr:MAG: hypothetical protein DMG81_03360 [Acidobacteriota bacterium]
MPTLNSLAKVAVKPIPKVISPKTHSIAGYITAGSLLASAAWLWRRNRRAAVAALVCGGTELVVNLATDYSGRGRKVIPFNARRELDLGLAGILATVPEFLEFRHEPEKNVFLAHGAALTVVSELTQYPDGQSGRRTRAA